ncbi:hypothetical protein CSC18_1406 [Klebsiella aerogenes]|nr:hypothetical protein CSC18_1406 [Klebsiella aerogenes]
MLQKSDVNDVFSPECYFYGEFYCSFWKRKRLAMWKLYESLIRKIN